MERLGKKREETRRKILDTSIRYFSTFGYKDTLISEIAKECNLDRRTIYRYFPSKESLLIRITAELFEDFSSKVKDIDFIECNNSYEKITKLVSFYYEYIKNHPSLIQFLGMIDVFVGTSSYNPSDFEALNIHGIRLDEKLKKFIGKGQEEGVIKIEHSAQEYAATINNSLLALATRTAIYQPSTILRHNGYAWKLIELQGKILVESLRVIK